MPNPAFSLRMPTPLKKALVVQAAAEGLSLNRYLIRELSAVAAKNGGVLLVMAGQQRKIKEIGEAEYVYPAGDPRNLVP